MALGLGNLTILIGAGVAGAVLAKEQRTMPTFSDVFSSAWKIFGYLKRDDSTSSSATKPRNDSLMAQVDSLREELKILASNRPITIVTGTGKGTGRYGIVIIFVVVGYGYVRWKGFKLPNMMFATRRSLADACDSVARQLESVYTSISAMKLHLSKNIDSLDGKLEESVKITGSTGEEALELEAKTGEFGEKVRAVRETVESLLTRISSVNDEKQEIQCRGIERLCEYVAEMENSITTQQKQALPSASSQPALELHSAIPSRTASMPAVLSVEPPPSSSNSRQEYVAPISPEASSNSTSANSRSGLSGLIGDSGVSGSFLTRIRSAKMSFWP